MATLPVGYRFHPTDDEIISYYLQLKNNGHDSLVDQFFREIDLCKFEPWELSDLARMKSDDQVWYFFCRLDYKYPNGKRASRTTKIGFWKLTGKVRYIKAKGRVIGSKRTLVFYLKARNNSTRASRTNWVIHEYQAETGHPNEGSFVVIKLKNKADEGGESGLIRIPDVETRPPVEEDDEDEFVNAVIAMIEMDFNHPSSSPQSRIPSEHDGASTSQFHAAKDDPELAKFADAFLNIPDSGTSQTLPDEFYGELPQCLLENRKLSSPHQQRKEHGLQSDDILVMGSGHEINRIEQLGVDDFIVGKIESQGDLSSSVLTTKVNDAKKHRADVPCPKQPEKPKEPEPPRPSRSFRSASNSNSATNVYMRLCGGFTPPPSSHGQSPPPSKPEPPKPSRHVTSDLNSRTNVSTNVCMSGGFIRSETPPSSHAQNRPSVYIINMAVGVLLLICCIWELLVRH